MSSPHPLANFSSENATVPDSFARESFTRERVTRGSVLRELQSEENSAPDSGLTGKLPPGLRPKAQISKVQLLHALGPERYLALALTLFCASCGELPASNPQTGKNVPSAGLESTAMKDQLPAGKSSSAPESTSQEPSIRNASSEQIQFSSSVEAEGIRYTYTSSTVYIDGQPEERKHRVEINGTQIVGAPNWVIFDKQEFFGWIHVDHETERIWVLEIPLNAAGTTEANASVTSAVYTYEGALEKVGVVSPP